MTRWIIKEQRLQITHKSKEEREDTRWEQLYNVISAACQEGWEPWAINISHAFNTAFDELTTFANVWYKRPDENNQHS